MKYFSMILIFCTNQIDITNNTKVQIHGSEHQIVTISIEHWDDAASHKLLNNVFIRFT